MQTSDQPMKGIVPVEFSGRGLEFFKIWIVNVLLTILTLGIYSAWAKVRTNQYFYGSTQVHGQSFQYLATGWQILKGRLIAALALVIFSVISNLSVVLYFVLILGLYAVIPWLIKSGIRFGARATSWRNVRFDFEGTYWGALKAFILWPMVGVLTLGILMPRAVQRSAQYMVEGYRFGTEKFEFSATPAHYGKVIYAYFIILVLLTVISIVSFVNGMLWVLPVFYIAVYLLALSVKPMLFNIFWNHVQLKGNTTEAAMPVGRFIWVFFSNSIVVALTLGLMYPWSKVRMTQLQCDSLLVRDAGTLGDITAAEQQKNSALGEELGEAFDVDVGFGV